jgi:hypothetical protein
MEKNFGDVNFGLIYLFGYFNFLSKDCGGKVGAIMIL